MKQVCSAQKKNGAESTWEGDRIFSLFLMSIYYTNKCMKMEFMENKGNFAYKW